MNIRENIMHRKNSVNQKAIKLARDTSNMIIDGIYKFATSDKVLMARWILLHLNERQNYIEVVFAIRDYSIIDLPENKRFDILDSDEFQGVDDCTNTCKELYAKYVFGNIKHFLKDQGFSNIETELPIEDNMLHPAEEKFEWYALEI